MNQVFRKIAEEIAGPIKRIAHPGCYEEWVDQIVNLLESKFLADEEIRVVQVLSLLAEKHPKDLAQLMKQENVEEHWATGRTGCLAFYKP